MKAQYRHEVLLRTENRKHLIPVFSHVFDIPRQVYEYDRSFFVVFNTQNQRYEIHSLDYPGDDTISCTVPYKDLDARTLRHIWRNDIRVHGNEIFKRLERQEEQMREEQERKRKKFTNDFAREHQSAFAKDAWAM